MRAYRKYILKDTLKSNCTLYMCRPSYIIPYNLCQYCALIGQWTAAILYFVFISFPWNNNILVLLINWLPWSYETFCFCLLVSQSNMNPKMKSWKRVVHDKNNDKIYNSPNTLLYKNVTISKCKSASSNCKWSFSSQNTNWPTWKM